MVEEGAGAVGGAPKAEAPREVPAILTRDIPWDTYRSASLLSAKEVELMRSYDHKPIATQLSLLEKDGEQYVEVFLTILKNISKEDVVQYVLALIEDFLSASPDKVQLFNKLATKVGPQKVFSPFLRLLSRSDPYTVQKSAQVLATVISAAKPTPTEELSSFVTWEINVLSNPTPASAEPNLLAVTSALMIQLRNEPARQLFLKSRGVALLVPLLKSQSLQLLYQTIFSLWLLSYHADVLKAFRDASVVPALVQVAKVISKEKVIRVTLATLTNLLSKNGFTNEMVQHGMVKTLTALSFHKWTDDDVLDDMRILVEALQANIKELSSFDVYKMEVLSGKLEWTPVHTEETFWKENVSKFEADDFLVLRALVALLKTPNSTSKTLAVASHDLGEFVRVHPRGKNILQQLEAKPLLLGLMNNEDAEVRKYALLAVQKLLCQHWEMLTTVIPPTSK